MINYFTVKFNFESELVAVVDKKGIDGNMFVTH
jgi:hypothetical protein